jgi:hypothetical protein
MLALPVSRRLAVISRQLAPARVEHHTTPQPAAAEAPDGDRLAQLREYISSGVVIVPPEEMGLPIGAHDAMYHSMCERLKDKTLGGNLTYYQAVPDLAAFFSAPGLVSVIDNILGEDWAYVPFMHSLFVKAGDSDQGCEQAAWHCISVFSLRETIL